MKKILGLILLLFSFSSFGQRLFPTILDTNNHTRELVLDGSVEFSSTSIDNGILNRFLLGGNISENTIQRNFDRQRMLNRVGVIAQGNLRYNDYKTNLFKSKKLGYGIQFGYEQFFDLTFTDQLFGLLFKGNEQYAGKSIDLNSTSLANIELQKLGFGILFKPSKSYVFLNVVNVSKYMDGGITHGTIKQSQELDDFIIDMNGNLNQPKSLNYFTGLGLSIDAAYYIPVHLFKNEHAKIKVAVNNLGFSYVYGGMKRYQVDTIEQYHGFTVRQLIDGFNTDQQHLMDTLGVSLRDGSKWIGLPFSLQLSKEVNEDYDGKFQSIFGIRVYPIASFRPLVFLGCDYRPITQLHIGLMASYGGYSTFRGTLYAQYKVSRFRIGVGCDNLVGIFSQKYGFGQTYNIRLSCEL